MDWQVRVVVELDREFDDTDDQVDSLIEALSPYGGSFGMPTDDQPLSLSATVTVTGARNAGGAAQHGHDLLAAALRELGYTVTAWTEAETISAAEAGRRLAEPTIPELVSGVEAAEILGVSRQRVHQLSAEHRDFPPPVVRLASGSIWLRTGVEGFARRWTRKPGRPAKAS